MARDPRTDPQPGDVLVFHDGTEPSLGRIESVGEDGMVRWRETGERWAFEIDDWSEYCRARKATVLEGTGPLTMFRWRPGGARGGEMPQVGTWLFVLVRDSYRTVFPALTASWDSRAWERVEWYVPIEELFPKEEPTP